MKKHVEGCKFTLFKTLSPGLSFISSKTYLKNKMNSTRRSCESVSQTTKLNSLNSTLKNSINNSVSDHMVESIKSCIYCNYLFISENELENHLSNCEIYQKDYISCGNCQEVILKNQFNVHIKGKCLEVVNKNYNNLIKKMPVLKDNYKHLDSKVFEDKDIEKTNVEKSRKIIQKFYSEPKINRFKTISKKKSLEDLYYIISKMRGYFSPSFEEMELKYSNIIKNYKNKCNFIKYIKEIEVNFENFIYEDLYLLSDSLKYLDSLICLKLKINAFCDRSYKPILFNLRYLNRLKSLNGPVPK